MGILQLVIQHLILWNNLSGVAAQFATQFGAMMNQCYNDNRCSSFQV